MLCGLSQCTHFRRQTHLCTYKLAFRMTCAKGHTEATDLPDVGPSFTDDVLVEVLEDAHLILVVVLDLKIHTAPIC